MIQALMEVTVRGLLSRRRAVLTIFLAAGPVLVALLARLAGRVNDLAVVTQILDNLVIRAVLPLVALVLGTAALGAELEDGTAIYTLAKPLARWRIVAAKLLVAGSLTAALVVPSAVIATFLLGGIDAAGSAVAYGLAVLAGSFLYGAAFLALSVLTGRALVIGLMYTLLWEGALSGLFAGTAMLSIRQYTLAIARMLSGFRAPESAVLLDGTTAVVLAVVAFVALSAAAVRLLENYEVRELD